MTTGTGMGLSTSRKIINDHGGQILAGSVQGEGTEFTITLPLVYEAPNMKPDAPAPKLETPLNILTVDDVEQLVLLLHDGLSEPDAHVFTAFSGEAAIDLFRKQSLDVVICDLGMPGMNGWEVATIIKTESEELGIPRPAFILLTGWGNQLDAGDKMETAGVDTIIQKPVDIPTLKDVIYEIAHKRRSLDW
jgi:CheY-like chemotaxis protein